MKSSERLSGRGHDSCFGSLFSHAFPMIKLANWLLQVVFNCSLPRIDDFYFLLSRILQ